MQRRTLLKASAAVLAVPRFAYAQQGYKAEYKMSTVVPPAFAWGKGGALFADLVRERTQGRINIKQYPGASLVQGQQDREFSAMRQGIIDILVGAPINWSGTVREFALFALPFLTPDYRSFDALIRSEVMTRDFFDIIRRSGGEPLAVGETGYRQVSNSKRAVRSPQDLEGLKIRVAPSAMYQETLTGLGANPTSMSWADAQPALASGAVDGQENPLEVFLAAKIHTLGQKFVTKWNYSNDPLLFVIARPIFDAWSKADQALVRQAAQDAASEQIKWVRAFFNEDVEKVRALGVQVHVPTPEETAAWQIACRRVYARWKGIVGQTLVAKAEQVVAQQKATL